MAYERIFWENLPSTATPRGATNLNRMDVGIAEAHAAIDAVGAVGAALYVVETASDARAVIGITRENPVPVLGAHTAAVGETLICLGGGFTVTVPDGDDHGDIITAIMPGGGSFSVDVDYFNIEGQATATQVLESGGGRGQQLTLRWIKDVEGLAPQPISGWYPTLIELLSTDTASP
ncbi:hypothetical protein [Mycolicibacter minnesotensis]